MCFLSTPLGFMEYLGIYRHQRRWRRARGGHNPVGRAEGPMACPGGLCSPQPTFLALLWPTGCFLIQKKFPKSFLAIGLCLVFIFCKVKNKQKQQLALWHYVNRLVPKDDIKLL